MDYFRISADVISDAFENYWGAAGISKTRSPGDVDLLLVVITRALKISGVSVSKQQVSRWAKSSSSLRKGNIQPSHIQRLKLRVKKMSLVWKAEGYALINFKMSQLFHRYLKKYSLAGCQEPAQIEKAINHFQKSLLVSPRDPVALRNVVNLYTQLWFGFEKSLGKAQRSQIKFLDFLWTILLEVYSSSLSFPSRCISLTASSGRFRRYAHTLLLCWILSFIWQVRTCRGMQVKG